MIDQGNQNEIIIDAKNITKRFESTVALENISFTLRKGQISCIVGENGAGKSTFIKILSGAYQADEGEITISGQTYRHISPSMSKNLGIGVIHQEIILVHQLSVAENIFVGMEHTNNGFFSYDKTYKAAQELIDSLGIKLDPKAIVGNLSAADQQFVKILKALAVNPKVLILDEPTAMFNMQDTDMVLDLVKSISKRGIAIIYISHHLKEVKDIADTVMVLRDGRKISEYDNSDKNIDLNMLTTDMVGRPVDMFYQKNESNIGDVILEVEGLKLDHNSPEINFNLRKGEVLGISGMVGSGRSEIVRALFGLDKKVCGKIKLNGNPIEVKCPNDSIKHGIGFISEDRQRNGLALALSVEKNITVMKNPTNRAGLLDLKKESEVAEEYVEKLSIKTSSVKKETKFLSGGNQQKVIIGKWLFNGFDILILDEPTKGIDVNAKYEIYKLLQSLTQEGKSIIMVSSDMPEIVSMSDRVLIVRHGQVCGEVTGKDISEESIINKALGVCGDGIRN